VKTVNVFWPAGNIKGSYVYNDEGALVAARIWDKDGAEWEKVDLQTAAITKEQDEQFEKEHPEPRLASSPDIPPPDSGYIMGDYPEDMQYPMPTGHMPVPTSSSYWLVEQFDNRGNATGRYLRLPDNPLSHYWTLSHTEAYRVYDEATARHLAILIGILQEKPAHVPMATEHWDM
jgi:hypothetical protein